MIFDIDNTLVCHGAPATAQAVELFKALREMGYDTLVLSNNKEPRVKSFAEAVGSRYIYKAGKPGLKGYQEAMAQFCTTPAETLFVGDQLFTDIWGAKRAGIDSVLVPQIDAKEEIQIVLKRKLEAIVLYFYRKKLKKEAENGNQRI